MTDKRIRIILDSKGAKRNADELNQSVRGVGNSANSAQFSMNKLAAAIASVITVQKVKQYADAWVSVQNQLRQTTDSQQELIATSERIVQIAVESRTELEATSQLYTRFRLSIDETTISSERLFDIVETINKSLALSGASAAESAGALRQLSQAIASGVLRGEEFNSIAEQAPGILRAVSLETGLATGQLRDFAAQGGITTEILIRALENYKGQVDEAFGQSNATIAQSTEVFRTSVIQFIGNLNDATGASYALADSIISLSETIRSGDFLLGVINYLEVAKATFNAASNSAGDFSSELILIKDVASESFGFIGKALKDLLPNVRSLVQVVTVELASGFDKLLITGKTLFEFFSNPFDEAKLSAAMDKYNAEMDAINSAREESIQLIFDEREAIFATAEAASKAKLQEIADRKAMRAESGSSATGFTGSVAGAGGKASKQDDGEREISSAKAVTRSLEQELALRRQIADIYRSYELGADASLYEQQLAMIQIREAEERAIAQAKFSEEAAQREERLAATLENEKLTQEARAALKAEFDAQELLSVQILEEEKTAIQEEAAKARIELDRAEWQARLDNAGALGDSLMALGQGQSKKIFKIGQTLALAQAAVALPAAVLESFKNGGGYPWGLVPAGAMLATGLKNIQQIKSAGAGLGGGGGGSVPAPSLGGGASGGSPSIPSTASTQQVEQRRVYELRGVAGNDKITVDQFKELMEQDGAVVVLSDSVNDANRRNVIGVTAR